MQNEKAQSAYQLTVNERQLRLINAALEEYFRLGLNQWLGLADRFIVIETVGRILWPHGLAKQDDDNILAQDIYQCIRYRLWLDDPDKDRFGFCVDGNKPFLQSSEPAIGCIRIEDFNAGRKSND